MAENSQKVLIVLASNSRRGAEIQGSQLAVELGKRGVDASAVALGASTSSATVPVPVLGDKPLAVQTLRAFRRLASESDIVIAYGSSTLPASAIALAHSTPFIYRSIGDPVAWVRGDWHRRRTAILMRRATTIATLWPGAMRSVEDLYGIPPSALRVIPNARSGTEFRPATAGERAVARERFHLPANAPVIAYVGAIAAEKCVPGIAEAVAQLDEAHLLVAGDGSERLAIETRARALLGDRTRFLGGLEDVRPVYHAADVVVLASSTEGMPGALVEASMSGLPTVATDVGAVRQIVADGETGIVIPDSRPATIASALTVALSDGLRLGANARERALAQFEWEFVAPQWLELLLETAGPA